MDPNKKISISIIGFGRLGKALYKVFKEKGYTVKTIHSRSNHIIPEFSDKWPQNNNELGDLIVIAVPDGEISGIVQQLAERYGNLSGKHIVHCSGTFGSDLLLPLQDKGADIAVFHPMQAVTDKTKSFENTTFDAEGGLETLIALKEISEDFGSHFMEIPKEAKIYLHAASVMASNYAVALMNLAVKMAAKGGIEPHEIENALISLMQSSLNNMKNNGIENALTGPIARGDIATIQLHLDGIKDDTELTKIYKLLGLESLGLSKADKQVLSKIKELLKE